MRSDLPSNAGIRRHLTARSPNSPDRIRGRCPQLREVKTPRDLTMRPWGVLFLYKRRFLIRTQDLRKPSPHKMTSNLRTCAADLTQQEKTGEGGVSIGASRAGFRRGGSLRGGNTEQGSAATKSPAMTTRLWSPLGRKFILLFVLQSPVTGWCCRRIPASRRPAARTRAASRARRAV